MSALLKLSLATLALLMTVQSSAAPVCKSIFTTNEELVSATEKTINELAALRVELDAKKADGISSAVLTAMESDFTKKEQLLLSEVQKNKVLTAQELRTAFKSAIAKVQVKRDDQNKKREETRKKEEQRKAISDAVIDGRNAVFHPIEPGSFNMKQEIALNGAPAVVDFPVTLTKPFSFMATPVTQVLWKTVAHLANSKLGTNLDLDPSANKGALHPVENIPYDAVIVWINSLNRLAESDVTALAEVFVGIQPGDKFRLPTEAEWEFVVKERGQNTDDIFFNNDRALLFSHAVMNTDKTQNVAQKLPLYVGGNPFYDMVAHVFEYTSDTSVSQYVPYRESHIDPHYHMPGQRIIRRGLSAGSWPPLSKSMGYSVKPTGDYNTGFRLVLEPRNSGDTP